MTSFRPIRAQHSLTAPQSPGSARATGSDFPDPGSDCAAGSYSQTPGSDRATGSDSPDPGNDRATGSQEMTHSIANKNHFLFNTILRCHALVTIGTCVTT